MGRAPKMGQKIDDDQVEKCAAIGMSMQEIADLFGVHKSDISEQFNEVYHRGKARVKKSLRMAQLEKALNHKDSSMLIHLGKHMLGQTEKQKLEHSGTAEIKVMSFGDEPIKPYDSSDS